MASHMFTPYEVTATRKYARKPEDKGPLLLASLGKDTPVDLLEVVSDNLLNVDAITSTDGTRSVSCVYLRRVGDAVEMVFACDIRGERETVHDPAAPGAPVVFTKGPGHSARFLSLALLHREPTATRGLLVVHSPWGRGGSKSQLVKLIQSACDMNDDAKAKLHADPKVPHAALEEILRRANATRIVYSRHTGIKSRFNRNTNDTTSGAEMALIVKGSDTLPFRNALATAMRRDGDKESLFTVKVRDETADGGYRDETFDDVEVEITTPGGKRRYSLRDSMIPTMGFNLTSEINDIYFDLPEDAHDDWPAILLGRASRHLHDVRRNSAGD